MRAEGDEREKERGTVRRVVLIDDKNNNCTRSDGSMKVAQLLPFHFDRGDEEEDPVRRCSVEEEKEQEKNSNHVTRFFTTKSRR